MGGGGNRSFLCLLFSSPDFRLRDFCEAGLNRLLIMNHGRRADLYAENRSTLQKQRTSSAPLPRLINVLG